MGYAITCGLLNMFAIGLFLWLKQKNKNVLFSVLTAGMILNMMNGTAVGFFYGNAISGWAMFIGGITMTFAGAGVALLCTSISRKFKAPAPTAIPRGRTTSKTL